MLHQTVNIRGQNLHLLPECCAYWEEEDILLIADLHIGKAEHFRNSGIPIPDTVSEQNLQVLKDVFEEIKPTRLLILGDLFHAQYNSSWNAFHELRKQFSSISFELVPGNHDILDKEVYQKSSIIIHSLEFTIPPFVFTHEHLMRDHTHYNISGHVHPAILLKGKGGQKMRFACFQFGKVKGLIPAFGEFTGMHVIHPGIEDKVFIIGDGKVFKF